MPPNTPSNNPSVAVLSAGPDAERPVSIRSATAVHTALIHAGYTASLHEIDAPSTDQLAALTAHADLIFPVLHGPWGEGGPLQDRLEALAKPYIGCRPQAARLAMDKLATKLAAARARVPTAPAAILNPADPVPPLPLPLVIKPTHEGSSVGLHLCHTIADYQTAHATATNPPTTSLRLSVSPSLPIQLIEPLLQGRELTVSLIPANAPAELRPLPIIEITPASGVYDYAAKYDRSDTRYTPSPELPEGVAQALSQYALTAAHAIGVRHLSRVDFILTQEGPSLLEINTMPGFTHTSLLPMAAKAAGIDLPALVNRLIQAALAD